jgi:LPXTG-motif cell wall-anchored protein
MQSLSVAVSGTKPSLQVTAGEIDQALLARLTASVRFESGSPQLCFDLTASANCPDLTLQPGDLSVPDGLIQVSAVSTTSNGQAVAAGEAEVELTGTNTSTVCTASVARETLPDVPDPIETEPVEPVLPETGGGTGIYALALMALFMTASGTWLVVRGRK